MSSLFNSIPYVLAGLTILLGFFQLRKEWDEYSTHKWLRRSVLAALIVVGVLTFISLRSDSKKKEQEKSDSETNTRELKSQVQAANKAQADNTRLFLDSFHTMSQEVSDLKAQVRTEALQKKLTSVEADLRKTQKALAPGPKADLTFSFVPFDNPPAGAAPPHASSETTLPLSPDGSVHVEFTILNMTEVVAANVELDMQICDNCKFAKEPDELTKLPGMRDTQRYLLLPHLQALQAYKTISLDVIPPPLASGFTVGFTYRCTSCLLRKEPSLGTVHILGR